ncbi:unnamed protein product [Aphanomyces euteiches]|nr:hypothetical protein AeRB84_010509 [Aphanomyces euteiches]
MQRITTALLLALSVALCVVASSWTPFGTLLGVTDGNVEVFSCHLEPEEEALDQDANYVDDIYTGVEWQCVELARRYLLVNKRVVFGNVDYAFQIFNLTSVRDVDHDGVHYALNAYANGGAVRPEVGSLLIWSPYGEMEITGHVAVVVAVTDTHVDIVEQNVEDSIWPEGQKYSRRLQVKQNATSFFIDKWYEKEVLIGWVTADLKTQVDAPSVQLATEVKSVGDVALVGFLASIGIFFVAFRHFKDRRPRHDYDLVQ